MHLVKTAHVLRDRTTTALRLWLYYKTCHLLPIGNQFL